MNQNQLLREALFIASDHLDMSAFELSHPKEADLIRAALAQPAEGGEVVAPQDGRWYWVQYEGLGRNYEAPAMFKKQADAFYSYEFSGIPARQVTVIRSIERTTPPASVVPDGYALIAVNVLKAWGKLEEVQAACVYPIASTPTSQEQAQQPNEPNCNRSACGDFSPGPCDNPDCTALHKAQQPQAQAQELPDEHPFRIAAYLRSSIAPQHPESNGITKAADLIEAMHRAALAAKSAPDVLVHIAMLAHSGGLSGLSESDALAAIRRLSIPAFKLTFDGKEAKAKVEAAIKAAGGEQ